MRIRLSQLLIIVALVAVALAYAAEAVRVFDGRSGRSLLSQAPG
jgi:hypothetical protein